VPRFVLSIAPENLASRGVATKLGFVRRSAWVEAEDGVEELWVREAPLVHQPRRRATVAPTPIRPASSIA
jgi:RimJ/RimL family protein N-acetyltransferase